jgi:hypothetical protein
MYSPVSFRGPGYFSQPSTSASLDTGTRAAPDELLLALAEAVAEADGEAEVLAEELAVALAEGAGEPTLAFASSLSGRISEAQPAMRETAPPSSRVRRLKRREVAERVLEERSGESIGELLDFFRGRLGAPGGGRVVVWRVG